MLVKEFALKLLQPDVRNDPWVREIFLAAGVSLDKLADRILNLYYAEDFDNMSMERLQWYETVMGLPSTGSEADRRAAVIAAYNVSTRPSLATIQAIVDNWSEGGARMEWNSYENEITIYFEGEYGIPRNLEQLKQAINAVVPVNVKVTYVYNTLLVKDIEGILTVSQTQAKTVSELQGG